MPLRVWAARAWARSEHWRARRAVDATHDSGALPLRRCFALGLRGRAPKKDRPLRDAIRVEPDLRPTIEHVLTS
jgi:hypothetical protein